MYNLHVAAFVEAGLAVGGSSPGADSTQKPQSVIFISALHRRSFSPLELPALAPVPDAVPPDSAPAGDVPWSETRQGYEGLQCEMNVLFEDPRLGARQDREGSDR